LRTKLFKKRLEENNKVNTTGRIINSGVVGEYLREYSTRKIFDGPASKM